MMRLTVTLLGQTFQAEGDAGSVIVTLQAFSKIVLSGNDDRVLGVLLAQRTQAQRGN